MVGRIRQSRKRRSLEEKAHSESNDFTCPEIGLGGPYPRLIGADEIAISHLRIRNFALLLFRVAFPNFDVEALDLLVQRG